MLLHSSYRWICQNVQCNSQFMCNSYYGCSLDWYIVWDESERVCQWVCVEIDVESLSTYQIDLYIPTAISYFTCCPTSLQGTVYRTATSWVRSVLCCSDLVYHRPQLYELLHVFCCVFIESATDSLAPPADSAFLLPILFYLIYLPMEPHQQIHGYKYVLSLYTKLYIKVHTVCLCFVFTVQLSCLQSVT